MDRTNKLRQKLGGGGTAIGSCIDSFSPAVVEVAGYSGLDFVRLDTEYSWRRDDTLEHMIRAAVLSDTTPLVRVEKGDRYLISKALQAGAGAILVTDIVSAKEAEEVVEAARFAPKGTRGYSTMTYAGKWGTDGGEDWAARCNAETLVGIMIENEEIVRQLDEVFAVEGLDFGFFGPSDYSMSIGLPFPQKGNTRVQDAIKRMSDAAQKHGKAAGIGIGEPWRAEAEAYTRMGCRILEIGHELSVLHSAWKAIIAEVK